MCMKERLFGSKLREKVLGWFFTHVDERFFVRQLELNHDFFGFTLIIEPRFNPA